MAIESSPSMPLAKSHIFIARGFEKASSPAVSSRTSDATCCNGCLTHLYTVHVCVACLLILRVRTNEPIWPIYQPVHIYIQSFICMSLFVVWHCVCLYIYIHTYIELSWWSYMPPHSLRAYSMWACSVNCALCHSQINFDPSFSVTDMGGTQHENLYVKPFYVLLWDKHG